MATIAMGWKGTATSAAIQMRFSLYEIAITSFGRVHPAADGKGGYAYVVVQPIVRICKLSDAAKRSPL